MTRASDEQADHDEHEAWLHLNHLVESQLDQAYKRHNRAFEALFKAVQEAKTAGWSNQDIGYVIGLSEGGVRMMLKRESKRKNRM